MPSYSVRAIVSWSRRDGQKRKFLYEERITAWKADSLDEAIELAETEVKKYSKREGFEALSLFQAYWLAKDPGAIPQGSELFSLLRESDLEPEQYLDKYFDTGAEKQTGYRDEQ